MILIADSGSTKTDWRLIDADGGIQQFQSEGLNPWFHSDSRIYEIISLALYDVDLLKVTNLYFYGAGITPGEMQSRIEALFVNVFPNTKVAVADDMLGAARALCDRQPGMAAILGTGANTCMSDGNEITSKQPALGYILGDEGSGAYMGKLLLKAYLQNELGEKLKASFERRFSLDRTAILTHLKEEHPNRFLAQFAKFLFQNKTDADAVNIIVRAFRDFFEQQVIKYPEHKNVPLHVTGSVGYYFGDFLRKVGAEYGVNIGKVVEKPVAALVFYHTEE